MNAIRRIIKREGNSLNVVLPDNFTANQVELIILPFEDNDLKPVNGKEDEAFRLHISAVFAKFNADLSGFQFNRDEVYS